YRLQPRADDDLGDRLARGGHLDVCSHPLPFLGREPRRQGARPGRPQLANASSTSSSCSMRCAALEPVAGLADSGRVTPANGLPATSPPHRTRSYPHAPRSAASPWTQPPGAAAGYGASAATTSSCLSG